MYRNKSYDEELSKELQDMEFAQGFLLTLIEGEEGLDLEDALKHTIERMGIKEYSKASRIPAPHVVSFIKGRRKLKTETLDAFLKPFRLKTKVVVEKAS
ncbi:MAG: hypothetical protein AB7F59_14550 [Bdellovibrionales bacterium]